MTEFIFDQDAAEIAEAFFAECLIHIEGPMAGQPFTLLDWQRQIVRDLFGWKRQNGTRRYRTAYIEIPRKNGKTTFAAGLALYLLLCEGEQGGQVYSAASTREQASLTYRIAVAMARQCSEIMDLVKIRESQKRITAPHLGAFYRAISSDAAGAHGYNASGIIFDEVHTQPDRDLWDVLETSKGARAQPLTVAITTAGYDRSSICWELHEYALKVIDDPECDISFYPVLFGTNPDDDWTDPAVWEKANPSIGQGVSWEYLQQECAKAQQIPSYENTFRRLHLNQWTEQESRVIPMDLWDACGGALPALAGRQCYVGLDLASTRDVTAMSLVFPAADDRFDVSAHFWIPSDSANARAEQDKRHVLNFARQRLIETTDGNEIDVAHLVDRIITILDEYDVIAIGYDPWNATAIVQLLQEAGIPLSTFVKMPQTFSTYNEPLKRLLGLLASGKLCHGGNKVLRWMASNTAHREDPSGNIRPDKGKSGDKIDGISAMLMALALALTSERQMQSIYEQAGQLVL